MTTSPVLTYLDRLITAVETRREVVPHDTLIKPRWRKDPYTWARERLKLPLRRWRAMAGQAYLDHRWDGTEEPLYTVAKELAAGHSVAVSSATGVGKTYLGAVLLLWFLDCWEGSEVITLAPKRDQLSLHLWKEVRRLWPLFKQLHPQAMLLQSMQLRMRPHDDEDGTGGWGAVGFPCGVSADEEVANRARGFHNEHLLFIVEETTGVHDSLLNAIALTCVAPHNLRLFFGNPDSDQDALALAGRSPNVVAVRASALDHPNVVTGDPLLVPGATSRQVLDEWREKYGEGHPLFDSRARGIAPGQAKHALIRREWCDAAIARAKDPEWAAVATRGAAAAGVDVAASDEGDKAALAFGRGPCCLELRAAPCPDPNAYGRHHVWPLVDSGLVKPERIGVDTVGVGVGCVKELKRLGAEVQALNGGEAFWKQYAGDEKFGNLRCQMYWQVRTDLHHELIGMPDDPELVADLTAPRWETRGGKIWVESKEDFKKRLGRSPDKGDAFVYWNWVRQATRDLVIPVGTRPVAF